MDAEDIPDEAADFFRLVGRVNPAFDGDGSGLGCNFELQLASIGVHRQVGFNAACQSEIVGREVTF